MNFNPQNRIDFLMIFDVANGNPNGDPDRNNAPRQDSMTGHGEVSAPCLKRKVRNYLQMAHSLPLFISQGAILNDKIAAAYDELGIKGKDKDGSSAEQAQVQAKLKQQYIDLRLFGGVLSTGRKAGQAWGPVQVSDARSLHPISAENWCITRMAATKGEEGKDEKTMGRKWIVPYAAYSTIVTYCPAREEISDQDLQLLVDALINCFELDRSAARGIMTTRSLIAFQHSSPVGSARLGALIDNVAITCPDHPSGWQDISIQVPPSTDTVKISDLVA